MESCNQELRNIQAYRMMMRVVFLALLLVSTISSPVEAADPSNSGAQKIAEEVSGNLLKRMKGELVEALQKGGPSHAISICSKRATSIAKELEESYPAVTEIKRTSFKIRNPTNAPNELEKEALRFFEEAKKKNDKLLPFFVQEEGRELHYYRPITIEAACLSCHGSKSAMGEAALDSLSKVYPDDKALDYKLGDFRGLLRVSIDIQGMENN